MLTWKEKWKVKLEDRKVKEENTEELVGLETKRLSRKNDLKLKRFMQLERGKEERMERKKK